MLYIIRDKDQNYLINYLMKSPAGLEPATTGLQDSIYKH